MIAANPYNVREELMNVARQYGANEDNFKYEVSFSDREF